MAVEPIHPRCAIAALRGVRDALAEEQIEGREVTIQQMITLLTRLIDEVQEGGGQYGN